MVAIRPKTRKRRRHERAAAAARGRLDQVRDEIRELGRVGQPVLARERDAVVTALMENRRALGHTASRGSVPVLAPMEIDHWVLWHPNADEVPTELRVGTLREGVDGESLGAPCVVPFRPGRSIVIVSRTDRQREQARDLWQSLVTRVAAITAGRSELVLLDPAGGSFTAGERLFDKVLRGGDVPVQLDRWAAETAAPGSRVIAARDVPIGYSQRDAALLLAMARTGHESSTLILHVDADQYRSSIGEPDFGADGVRWLIDIGSPELTDGGMHSAVLWDGAPQEAVLGLVADRAAPH